MNKLIKSQAVVDGTLCRTVRVRDSLEEVGAEREEGRRHQLHSRNGVGCETESLNSVPSLHQFIEISHAPGQ